MKTISIYTNIFTGIGGGGGGGGGVILGHFITRKQDEMKNVSTRNVHPWKHNNKQKRCSEPDEAQIVHCSCDFCPAAVKICNILFTGCVKFLLVNRTH